MGDEYRRLFETRIQIGAPRMPESATLSAPASLAAPAVAGQSLRWSWRIDRLLVVLVLAFAFVAGSFVARNSDLWLHRATGRLIVTGDYRFGSDPFTYTATNQYWANHAWLYDLGFYLVIEWFGASAVVALKATAVAATAGVMLLVARGVGPLWIAASCVLLAVLAMSPRLLMQPVLVSFLFLSICLYCLQVGGRALVALPILAALWVNVDAWFILAPILVGLFWIGRKLEAKPSQLPSHPWPRWFVPALIMACLLSPHHIHAFSLPLELSPSVWTSEFTSDARFAGLFVSPWHTAALGAAGGYNLAAWAFFLLLGLSAASFVVNRSAIPGWRGVVWLAFAALAAWQARLIPFFAIVAGPIAALNLGEVRYATRFRLSAPILVLTAGLVLIGLTALGFTNGYRNKDRGMAWGIHQDPTLERVACGIQTWRHENSISPDSHVFAAHPEIGHYLAWFAPGERYYLDSRLQLFTGSASHYAEVSRLLGLLPPNETDQSKLDKLLQVHSVAAVSLYDPDFGRMNRAIRELSRQLSTRWDVARVDGAAILMVPKGTLPSDRLFDPDRLVFEPDANDLIPPLQDGKTAFAEAGYWWEIRDRQGRNGSWPADATTIYLRLFEEQWGQAAGRSPALPLLAAHAARAGIEIDMKDPTAWLVLARSYMLLGERTWENEVAEGLTPLTHLRLIQVTTALVQAALRNPDSLPTRELLVGVFLRRQIFDLAHPHAIAALRLIRQYGQGSQETPEAFADRLNNAEELVNALERAIQDGGNRYLIRTEGLSGNPLARARIAVELGLHQKAIDVLQFSHPDLYGVEGIALMVDLLLQSGQSVAARVLLERDELRRNPDVLRIYELPGKPHQGGHQWSYRLPAYHWFDLCESAAAGRYNAALSACDRIRERLELDERAMISPDLLLVLAQQLGSEAGLGAPLGHSPALRLSAAWKTNRFGDFLRHARFLSVARADIGALAGVLELERGNPAAADKRFQEALRVYSEAENTAPSLPGKPLTTRYSNAIHRSR
jgi:tetratricopeptide (TPR) repeat protein